MKAGGQSTVYNKCGSPEHPKLRVVPYPDLTLDLLQRDIEKNGVSREGLVFTYNGSPVSNPLAECAFNRALLKAGFTPPLATLKANGNWSRGRVVKKDGFITDGRRLIPHSLRYTYITRMSRDVDAHNLLKITGHDSTAMIDYYNRKNLEMALAAIPNTQAATSALLPAAITKAV